MEPKEKTKNQCKCQTMNAENVRATHLKIVFAVISASYLQLKHPHLPTFAQISPSHHPIFTPSASSSYNPSSFTQSATPVVHKSPTVPHSPAFAAFLTTVLLTPAFGVASTNST